MEWELSFCKWIVKALKIRGKAFVVVPDDSKNKLIHYVNYLMNSYLDALFHSKNRFYSLGEQKKTYILADNSNYKNGNENRSRFNSGCK